MADHDTHDHTGIPGVGGGGVATDSIWDAAGDLAVGSGADTAARLAIGAAGGAVSRINGAVAWNSVTSNPGSAATGDRIWRTDLRLEAFYDGTRWLCTCLHDARFAATEVLIPKADTGNTTTLQRDFVLDEFGIYIEDFVATTFMATGDGSNFWTVGFDWETAGVVATSLGTISTAADTVANFVRHRTAVDAVLDSTARDLRITATDTGAPGTLRVMPGYTYRRIIT